MPFSVTEEESRLMRLWLEQQAMETVDSREVKACRGGDLARWQGMRPGKMPHCIMVWGEMPAGWCRG